MLTLSLNLAHTPQGTQDRTANTPRDLLSRPCSLDQEKSHSHATCLTSLEDGAATARQQHSLHPKNAKFCLAHCPYLLHHTGQQKSGSVVADQNETNNRTSTNQGEKKPPYRQQNRYRHNRRCRSISSDGRTLEPWVRSLANDGTRKWDTGLTYYSPPLSAVLHAIDQPQIVRFPNITQSEVDDD